MNRPIYRAIVASLLLAFTGSARAQTPHDLKDQIQSLNWDIIGNIGFRVVNDTEIYPVYNATVKRFAGRSFILEGYIVPVQSGRKHSKFLLSTLPINQCFFCGQNGNPIMIMVEMKEPLDYATGPVKLRGILHLENINAAVSPPVTLKDAAVLGRK